MSVWGEENTDGHDDDNEDLLDNEDLQALEETIEGPERRGSEVRLRRSEAEDTVASKKQGQNTTNRRPPSANPSLRPGSALSRPMSAATLRPMSASSRIEILRPSSAYRQPNCLLERMPSRFTIFDRDHAGLIDHGKIISHRKPRPGSATAVNARIKPAATLFLAPQGKERKEFSSMSQHRRPDIFRAQVFDGDRSLVHKIKPPSDLTYFDQWLDRLRGQLEQQIGPTAASEIGARWRPGASRGMHATYLASEWQHDMAKVQTELLRRTNSHQD